MFPNFKALIEGTYMVLDTKIVYLLLGSNLGERNLLIEEAILYTNNKIGKVKARSSFYETAAWGNEDQPAFLNVAVAIVTHLTALEVLEGVLAIEKELGRVRLEKWGARLIDIDIIFYGDEVIDINNKLQIPHPEMQYRKFVLKPMAEIAGDVKHPVLGKTVSEILANLQDQLTVMKI